MKLEKIKEFLKPTSFKLMVFFILVSAFLLISSYQTFELYSTAAMMGHSQSIELKSLINECQDDRDCIGSIDTKNVEVKPSGSLIVYFLSTIKSYNDLETAKKVIYPFSEGLMSDYEGSYGYQYSLGWDLDEMVGTMILDENVFGSEAYRKDSVPIGDGLLPEIIILDFAPVYAEKFFLNFFAFVAYLYFVSCVVGLISRIVSEKIKIRL